MSDYLSASQAMITPKPELKLPDLNYHVGGIQVLPSVEGNPLVIPPYVCLSIASLELMVLCLQYMPKHVLLSRPLLKFADFSSYGC